MSPKVLPRLAIVLPCYRESESIEPARLALTGILDDMAGRGELQREWCLCFVDDGSDDATWQQIQSAATKDHRIRGIRLANNIGQQAALLAGLGCLSQEFTIYLTMDVDLQDNPAAVPEMLTILANGYDLVYGVRSKRHADSFFKRQSATAYYRLLALTGVKVIPHHADFRAFNSRVLEALLMHPHAHLFLRAVFPKLGFNGTTVTYERLPRKQGQTKYSLWKMLALAIDGLTLLTSAPLKAILLVGALSLSVALGAFGWILFNFLQGNGIPAWATPSVPLIFFGALQCIALALIGEYLRRIYLDKKRYPVYKIRESTGFPKPLANAISLPDHFPRIYTSPS